MSWFEVKSPKRGAKLRLDASFFVIGRGERIPIFHDDPSISREHAAIVIRKSGVRIRDLGSKNGVLLNGAKIGKYAEVEVKPGDSIRVGATTLVLREGEPPVAIEKPVEEEPPAATSSDDEDDAEPAPAPAEAEKAPSDPEEKAPEAKASGSDAIAGAEKSAPPEVAPSVPPPAEETPSSEATVLE